MKSITYFSVISFLSIGWIFDLFPFSIFDGSDKSINTRIVQDGKFDVYYIDNNEMSFGVSMTKPKRSEFFLNSNFFSPSGDPIGLVVMDRKKHSNRSVGGGYFYVVDGVPHVSVGYCPRMTDFASQTLFWGIDNGKLNTGLFNNNSSNEVTSRSMIGEDKNGNIMVVSSPDGCTIKELVEYSSYNGMYEGILLDGGSSTEYKYTDKSTEIDFKSTNSILKDLVGRDEPPVFIYGYFK